MGFGKRVCYVCYDIVVPSLVDGKRRYLARVSVPRDKITHECKIPSLSIHE